LESGLERPKFLEKSGNFNRSWVKNPKTLAIIESNKTYEYLYTVFITNLRKPKYPSGLLSEAIIQKFNKKIEEIDNVVSDDYSFLEFNSIFKEDDQSIKEPENKPANKPVNVEKSIVLLQTFFDANRKGFVGKDSVNVIVCNCSELSNSIIKEAERLFKLNGNRTVIMHDVFAAKKSYIIEDDVIRAFMSKFVDDNNELFLGYKFLEVPFLSRVIKQLSPEFSVNKISCFDGCTDFEMELSGIKAYMLNKSPDIEILKAKAKAKDAMIKSLETDSYKGFCDNTPQCLHPFWPVIKSAFDKYTYR
jgi:hypothetical protein